MTLDAGSSADDGAVFSRQLVCLGGGGEIFVSALEHELGCRGPVRLRCLQAVVVQCGANNLVSPSHEIHRKGDQTNCAALMCLGKGAADPSESAVLTTGATGSS
jgi:hypothetical protein